VLLVAQVSDREGGQLSHPRYLVFSLGVTVKTRLLFLFLPLHEVYVLLVTSTCWSWSQPDRWMTA